MDVYEQLSNVNLFADLHEDDLRRIAGAVGLVDLNEGEYLFHEGDAGDSAYVVVDGEIEIVKAVDGREVLLAVRGAGELIGEMALLEEAPRMASIRTPEGAQFLALKKADLDALLESSSSAVRAIFRTLMTRWRETQGQLRQSERMAQLGTLTAGVAHELNNPAAAAKRAAVQLHEARDELRHAYTAVYGADFAIEQRLAVSGLIDGIPAPSAVDELDGLDRADREDDLEQWLDDHGVADSWELASQLVAIGLVADDMDAAMEPFQPEQIQHVARVLAAERTVQGLVYEIDQSVGRLSGIVKALKGYSYLDQAPVQEILVTEGIDDTLLILRGKLAGIEVVRDYPDDLPKIEAYGSELNQVWTNLLDNAAYAISEAGQDDGSITVRVRCEDDERVVVELEDNGPGIPEDIQAKVFDSFFTTKPPGSGTGLGLDITYRIVVHKHRGDIRVESEPGRTVFRVELPTRR